MADLKNLTKEQKRCYLFLNRLRETGVTNMFGASPYLVEHMGLKRHEASKMLGDWMRWVTENPSRRDL